MKKYIRSDSRDNLEYRELRSEIINTLVDHISASSALSAEELANMVEGYDPNWCKEYSDVKHNIMITKAVRQVASLIADDYLCYYGQ